jgi:hypothetical protein
VLRVRFVQGSQPWPATKKVPQPTLRPETGLSQGAALTARARIEGEDEPPLELTVEGAWSPRSGLLSEVTRRLRGPHLEWAVCSAAGTLEQWLNDLEGVLDVAPQHRRHDPRTKPLNYLGSFLHDGVLEGMNQENHE